MNDQPNEHRKARDAYDALHYAGDLGQLAHTVARVNAKPHSTFRRVVKIAAMILIIMWIGSALSSRHNSQVLDVSQGMNVSLKNQPTLPTGLPSISLPSLSGRLTSIPKIQGSLPTFGRLLVPGQDASTPTPSNPNKELAI